MRRTAVSQAEHVLLDVQERLAADRDNNTEQRWAIMAGRE